jgi:hypothetical protein
MRESAKSFNATSYTVCGKSSFPKTGDELSNHRQAIGIISEASVYQPDLIVIPAERLSSEFFRLKTGVAGEILQKFATYRKPL